MDRYVEKNISTKQPPSSEKTRLPGEDEYQGRPQRAEAQKAERTQAIDAVPLLRLRLTKDQRLRKPGDFRRVYAGGERIKGRFMTAFFMPSETSFQRIGITASKKAVGNSVRRNRAKRLLREAFRMSKQDLDSLALKYDWVLNARADLLDVKLEEPLKEFREIVEKVRRAESLLEKGEKDVEPLKQ
jgi:ribonuclease P protein component